MIATFALLLCTFLPVNGFFITVNESRICPYQNVEVALTANISTQKLHIYRLQYDDIDISGEEISSSSASTELHLVHEQDVTLEEAEEMVPLIDITHIVDSNTSEVFLLRFSRPIPSMPSISSLEDLNQYFDLTLPLTGPVTGVWRSAFELQLNLSPPDISLITSSLSSSSLDSVKASWRGGSSGHKSFTKVLKLHFMDAGKYQLSLTRRLASDNMPDDNAMVTVLPCNDRREREVESKEDIEDEDIEFRDPLIARLRIQGPLAVSGSETLKLASSSLPFMVFDSQVKSFLLFIIQSLFLFLYLFFHSLSLLNFYLLPLLFLPSSIFSLKMLIEQLLPERIDVVATT